MQKDYYNQETTTPSKESNNNAFIQKLLSTTSPLALISGTHNLADIINLSETSKAPKKRGRKSNTERSMSVSLRNLDPSGLEFSNIKSQRARFQHKFSLCEEQHFTEPAHRNSGQDIDAFVKLPEKKAKNEIVRQPESIENQQLTKLGVGDFDSDSEVPIPHNFGYETDYLPVRFISKHAAGPAKRIKKAEGRVFDLLDFVQRRDDRTRLDKVYACKYCPKVYAKRAALGGHTAKNHPHLSDSYKVRQLSMNSRKIERERFDFFKNL